MYNKLKAGFPAFLLDNKGGASRRPQFILLTKIIHTPDFSTYNDSEKCFLHFILYHYRGKNYAR